MNKREFLECFDAEDKNSIGHIYEKYQLTEYGLKGITEEFYPPLIWAKILELENKLKVKIDTLGYFPDSERRIIVFTGEECYENDKEIIVLLCIKNLSKFKELAHKDYLGGLMSLGIKREKIGDLIIEDNCCYFPTLKTLAEVIINELKVIGKNPVEITYSNKKNVEITFEDLNLIMASNRLDVVVSAITKLSREESNKVIERGEVRVNYFITKEKNTKIKENSVISIKYFGKYKYIGVIGETKKDKLRVLVKKFV